MLLHKAQQVVFRCEFSFFRERRREMDRRNTDLTRERRIHLRDFLQKVAGGNEQVVAIKEVPVGGSARVAFEEGGLICLSPVLVTAVSSSEVLACHAWGVEKIAFYPDCPCLVRE